MLAFFMIKIDAAVYFSSEKEHAQRQNGFMFHQTVCERKHDLNVRLTFSQFLFLRPVEVCRIQSFRAFYVLLQAGMD